MEQFVRPVQAFTHTQASSGIVLLIATAQALIWANSPWSGSYHDLLDHRIGFDLGFSSQSSFTRFFASNVGMAPTDYRRVAKRI